MGMNSVDMYQATKLEKGTLKYKRAKTKDRRADEAYIEVKIHPFIKPLMKRYEGSTHVFSFYKKYVVPENFNNNINRGLKDLGRAILLNQRSYSYTVFDGINTYTYDYTLCGRTMMLRATFKLWNHAE